MVKLFDTDNFETNKIKNPTKNKGERVNDKK